MVCADKNNFYHELMREKFKKEIAHIGDLIKDTSICISRGVYNPSINLEKFEKDLDEFEHECFIAHRNYKLFDDNDSELPDYSAFKSRIKNIKKTLREDVKYWGF